MQADYVQDVQASGSSLYQTPRLYDVAFSHRDYPAEIHVLTEWYLSVTKGAPLASVLELAAGPANHSIEYLRRGVSATALDICQQMTEYSSQKARQRGLFLRTVSADMLNFRLRDRFDMAMLLTDSACHIHSAKDMIRHLRCVGDHLNPGGLYVIELTKSSSPNSVNKWSARDNGVEVSIEWGAQNGDHESRRMVSTTKVSVSGNVEGQSIEMSETIKTRSWSQFALEKAITASGSFTVARRFGDFLSGSSINDNSAPRLIYILKKNA
jgi:SAM-dependent methyltransferase